jgi:hypothetical protein
MQCDGDELSGTGSGALSAYLHTCILAHRSLGNSSNRCRNVHESQALKSLLFR